MSFENTGGASREGGNALTLYMHPLSSYCHKVLIALYENATPFTACSVDLGDPVARAQFEKVWPIAQFPVLRDEARDRTVPESSVIIEYLGRYYPGPVPLMPEDPERAAQVRAIDRFYDLHIHQHMQKMVGDKLRSPDGRDPVGVAQAEERLRTALRVAESEMAHRRWAAGEQFTMADCAAAPALYYINRMAPLTEEFPCVSAYLDRLTSRPSYARALAEAEPYLARFPG
jgi:glutathione S-transferase